MGEPTFGELLRDYRRAAGYSQESLAERAGLSVGAIAALEQGIRRAPHRDTVDALANALAMPESTLRQFEDAAAHARKRHRHDSSLPTSLTSFVERNEVNELQALLAEHQLVTITGSGGVGKTRIAIEVARRTEHLYDEVLFVDLLPIREGHLVASQIAARLGVPSDDGLIEIVRHLRPRHALLVLDNCEHVVADAASVVANLLHRLASLSVLGTSREPLALSCELAYRLPGMNARSARDLFVVRAQACDPALSFDSQRLAIAADICKELDGIPLAIELAASRASTLGFEPLRARLHGGVSLIGSRDLPLRHQTMTATIAWSYDLLGALEQLLLRRLSVFAGGFTLEAAEDVCSGESLSAAAVANGVSTLVWKSLINTEHVGTSTRYRFLDSIQTFARERLLEHGGLETSMFRLIGWLKRKAAMLDSLPPTELIVQERAELENVGTAVRWAQSTGQQPTIVDAALIVTGFRSVWFYSHRQSELRTLGLLLLQSLNEAEAPEVAGRLMHAVAQTLNGAEYVTIALRAAPLLIETGHAARAAHLHSRTALFEWKRGDVGAAQHHLVVAAGLLTTPELRHSPDGITAAMDSAYLRSSLGDFAGARALLEQMEAFPGLGVRAIYGQLILAEIEFREHHIEKALDLLKSVKSETARYPHEELLVILAFGNAAQCELVAGDREAAEDDMRTALRRAADWRSPGVRYVIVNFARTAAALAALAGRLELAARLLGACDVAEERRGEPSEEDTVVNEILDLTLREHLSDEAAAALQAEGAGEDLYDLLEEYLAQPAADDSARLSATSSPRATSAMRSSPS